MALHGKASNSASLSVCDWSRLNANSYMSGTPTKASSVRNHSPVPSRPYYVWLVAGGAVDSDGVLIASFTSVFFSDLVVAMYCMFVPCTIRAIVVQRCTTLQ